MVTIFRVIMSMMVALNARRNRSVRDNGHGIDLEPYSEVQISSKRLRGGAIWTVGAGHLAPFRFGKNVQGLYSCSRVLVMMNAGGTVINLLSH